MDTVDVQKNYDQTSYRNDQYSQNSNRLFDSVRRISWSSVFAGVLIAVVVQIALSLLGIGIGLSTLDVKTEAHPANGLGIGSAIWYVVASLISLFAGGFVAGRLAQSRNTFDGVIHGLLSWSLITLITLYFLTSTIGSIIGGVGSLVGNTLSAAGNIAGKGVSAAAPAIKDELQNQGINLDNLKQEAKTVLRQTGKPALQPGALSKDVNATANNAQNAASDAAANPQGADEQISDLFDKIQKRGDNVASAADKQAMVNVIVARTGKSEAEAGQIADNWIATYNKAAAQWQQTKQEAAAKAKDIADKAADVASTAAIITFFSLLIGAIVSAFGAKTGTDSKDNSNRNQPVAVSA